MARNIWALVLGSTIGLGVCSGGFLMGKAYKDAWLLNRTVTVKGLAEEEVRATNAVWHLGFSEHGDDVTVIYEEAEKKELQIRNFLLKQGFQEEEISQGRVATQDRKEWGGDDKNARYSISTNLEVHSRDVNKVLSSVKKIRELLKEGIALNANEPLYIFDGVNEIKPKLIAKATQNARLAGEQFAADSGSKLGGIRSATQGSISIVPRGGAGSINESYGYQSESASIEKVIRVVTTVNFSLVD